MASCAVVVVVVVLCIVEQQNVILSLTLIRSFRPGSVGVTATMTKGKRYNVLLHMIVRVTRNTIEEIRSSVIRASNY